MLEIKSNEGAPARTRDLTLLAPGFERAVRAALVECALLGLEVYVFETVRSEELQAYYYAQGRTRKPPNYTVTNARTAKGSWHFYGLAIDVIHEEYGWFNNARAIHRWPDPRKRAEAAREWFKRVAAVFIKHGCKWGGHWKKPDMPHIQWGTLKDSPSIKARMLYKVGGRPAVWKAVGAN